MMISCDQCQGSVSDNFVEEEIFHVGLQFCRIKRLEKSFIDMAVHLFYIEAGTINPRKGLLFH